MSNRIAQIIDILLPTSFVLATIAIHDINSKRYHDVCDKINKIEWILEDKIRSETKTIRLDANTISETYQNNQSIQLISSKKICSDWTNTQCETAKDIIPFLQKYKNMNTSAKTSFPAPLNKLYTRDEIQDYTTIENYRKSELNFWRYEIELPDYPFRDLSYPRIKDVKTFSTFHWAIHNTISNVKEPSTYLWLDNSCIYTDKEIEEIRAYRDIIYEDMQLIS